MKKEKLIENLEKAIDICDSTPHENKEEVMAAIEEIIEILKALEASQFESPLNKHGSPLNARGYLL